MVVEKSLPQALRVNIESQLRWTWQYQGQETTQLSEAADYSLDAQSRSASTTAHAL